MFFNPVLRLPSMLIFILYAGQSYVALSRAASLDGLQVVRFDPTKVRC